VVSPDIVVEHVAEAARSNSIICDQVRSKLFESLKEKRPAGKISHIAIAVIFE
jgi:hypothetical protein